MFFQATGGRFYGISHHQDGSLFRERVRPRIGESLFVYFAVGILVFERVIEVFGFSASVMGTDKIDDGFWQHCFFCDLDTVVHMIDNDFRALVER